MIYEIFKAPNSNRSEFIIISENENIYYLPSTLTVREAEEVLYALYGEYVDWTEVAKNNFSTEEFEEIGYELYNYATHHPEKTIADILNNPDVLRAYAEESFQNALWHDIQDAKER